MAKSKNIDMLHGSLWDKMVIFALPLALTGMLQQLYNAADVAVLGKFVGTTAMAAVGNNIAIIGIIVTLFLGLSLGGNVIIARFIGAKQRERAQAALHTAFVLALIIGFSMAILGQVSAGAIIEWLQVPSEVEEMAETYLRVYLLGMPLLALYNFQSAIFRAQGDTRTPLMALMVSSMSNVIMDLLFVQLGLGVAGVALATDLSNGISSGILCWKLLHAKEGLRLQLSKLRPERVLLKNIIKIGLPAGIQGMVFSVSNILIQAAINSLGPDAMAASAAAFTIEINVYCFLNAFAQATTTFVSQNYGAGNMARCLMVTKRGMMLALGSTMGMAALVLLLSQQLLGFFNPDVNVIALGTVRLWYIVAPEFLQVFIDVFSGALRGYGYSLGPAILTLVGICGVRIIWLYSVFAVCSTYDVLMACYSISWLVTGAMIVGLYLHYRGKILGANAK